MKFLEKISWTLRRHPILYYVRYMLLSENFKGTNFDKVGCFNDINDLKDIPQLFFDVNTKINIIPDSTDFEKATQIAIFLRNGCIIGPGLSLASDKTLEKMLAKKGGICSDFSQVFSIFCFINGIRVKEWACIDSLYKGKYGHTFNEIYSKELNQWVAIDSHKGIYFTNENNKRLSVQELFNNLRAGKPLHYKFISDYVPHKLERLVFVYSKTTIPYILGNYVNVTNDYYLNKFQKKYPHFIINLIMIIKGKSSKFVFVMDNYKFKLLPERIQKLIKK